MAVKYLSGNRVTALSTDLVTETTTSYGTSTGGTATNIDYTVAGKFTLSQKSKITALGVRTKTTGQSVKICLATGTINTNDGVVLAQAENTNTVDGYTDVTIDYTAEAGDYWILAVQTATGIPYPQFYTSSNSSSDFAYNNNDDYKTSDYALAFNTTNQGQPLIKLQGGNNAGFRYTISSPKLGTTTSQPTLSDDFTSDNWLQQDSAKIGVDDTTNYRLDIELSRADNDGATVDLGSTVSDTEWILRWKQTWTTLSAGNNILILVGLSDDPSSDYSSISNLSSYFMMETSASAKKRFGVNWSVDAQPFANNSRDTDKALAEDTEYFMELKRTSATTATWTAWTGSYGGTQIHTFSASDSDIGNVDNLRYIRVQNAGDGGSDSGSGIGYIKDIEFYNGITAITTTDNAVTVPNGSVVEETNTGKHKIWNSTTSAWVEVG
jgi:hypothetical protein